jgi:hypothetical protein
MYPNTVDGHKFETDSKNIATSDVRSVNYSWEPQEEGIMSTSVRNQGLIDQYEKETNSEG